MMSTEKLPRARELLGELGLFPAGCRVLCAVSGGNDSMCLLHFLSELAREQKFDLAAAHFNHQMRGERAEEDERFVRAWCEDRKIPCYTGSGDVYGQASRRKKGVEETGHAMRYAFFEETAAKWGADFIATAHHADDNAETVLLHLVRGAGGRGLSGIPPRRGRYVRPFLTTARGELEAYRAAWGISCVYDSTNGDDAYARNRVRHQVMPLLETVNPQAVGAISAAALRLRRDEEFLSALALEKIPLAAQGERVTLSAQALADAPEVLQVRAVRRALELLGQYDCTQAHLLSVIQLARRGPSARADLPGALAAWREYDRLVLGPAPVLPPMGERSLLPGQSVITGDGLWQVSCTETVCPEGAEATAEHFYLCAGRVELPLLLRPRREGDRLSLPGERGSRTVKKRMIDARIPRWRREHLPVLADGSGVVAVAALGPERTRLASFGEKTYEIKIQEKEDDSRNETT